jgi:membrane-associated phospholipid phosphatase
MTRSSTALLLTLLLALAPQAALAQSVPDVGGLKRPLVAENFSPFELTTLGVASAGALTLMMGGDAIFGQPKPSMGPPAYDSIDARFSRWANPNPDPASQWLGGAPDLGGYAMPIVALAFYGTGAAGNALSSDFFIGDTTHELIAFGESLAWSMLVVNGLKFMVGRERPFVAKSRAGEVAPRDQWDVPQKEENISFPSGHSAAAAVTMTFVMLDLSDHLYYNSLSGQHGAVRWGVGRLLPALAGAGVTWTVMYSRIKDQRHWLSDTLVGAFVGTTFATIFYTMHFDDKGKARRRYKACDDCDESTATTTQHIIAPTMLPHSGVGFGWFTTF